MTSRSQDICAANRRSDRLRILQRVNALQHHQNHMNTAMTTAAAATPLKSTGHTCAAPSNLVFLQRCTELVRVGAGEQQLWSARPHVAARAFSCAAHLTASVHRRDAQLQLSPPPHHTQSGPCKHAAASSFVRRQAISSSVRAASAASTHFNSTMHA